MGIITKWKKWKKRREDERKRIKQEERRRRREAREEVNRKNKERERKIKEEREKRCPNCYKELVEKKHCKICGWMPCVVRDDYNIECPAPLNKKFYSWCESKSCGRYKNVEKERSRKISQKVKNEVWRRDSGRCVGCGSRVNLEYDHIIPFSKGGSNTARNIELLCEKCNRSKHDKI